MANSSDYHEKTTSRMNPELRTRLYVDLLQSLALEDPSLSEVMENLTLAMALKNALNPDNSQPTDKSLEISILDDSDNSSKRCGAFQESELLAIGIRDRYHLNISTRKRLLEEVQNTLRSIWNFIDEDQSKLDEDTDALPMLPEIIQAHKDEIEEMREEITLRCGRVKDLIVQITEARAALNHEVKQGMTATLPEHAAARSASIDLLAATIEASLVRLSLTQARAERDLYTHSSQKTGPNENAGVGKAVAIAYSALRKEEKEMRAEVRSLDQQLNEYESLLQLVDGGKGGYQQVVNDWTKVKQETDECLKDLRRLGWTGD